MSRKSYNQKEHAISKQPYRERKRRNVQKITVKFFLNIFCSKNPMLYVTYSKSRKYTNTLLDMVDEGLLDKDTVIMACVKYMSEDEVKDMMECNEFILDEDEEEEDE